MVFLSPRQRSFVMLTTAVLIFTISLLITFAIQTVTVVFFGLKFAKLPAGVIFAAGSLALSKNRTFLLPRKWRGL